MLGDKLINLTSIEAQNGIRFELLTRLVIRVGIVIIAILSVLIIFMLTSLIYITTLKGGVSENTKTWRILGQTTESDEVKQKVKASADFIRYVSKLSTDPFKWSSTIRDVVVSLPPTVYLTAISGSQAQRNIVISGFAPTRDDVLQLEDMLKKLPFISLVDSPDSNVIAEKNITFQFTLILNNIRQQEEKTDKKSK
ncbi:MAG: hypothetical protein A3A80_02630 [Candidatus Terrybacteria bacterium RIFCSPLOWO2_01_FULL_44_24]|uniref:Uncharacterized protein n=1 Tax=Candidatus Terrybacteria bacterium RIFCSPHIGHO2_01_FULL_43_35 TaxID=1802361 RepID=A0A1G2PGJ3_9BACT|nr:MAG: hypothetical protein A2828_02425 [Candidatus Terrybacteria bacterium RIFCSPHIGHO2_01_FULL_43_35]OHA50279.1 MAG: hypothetical protein A3B75_00570 [Candidatus Terrybacteria bacterium RIFCSPHIGHO2_02_FULL_43_14]OHA50968.1 MAG: hypothetical protein A3A80_02630 [Candidatus Terrybacteria bacterium RIFCSPLOWO2_01_FULL_44_24]